ncbi:hypothetical protein ACFYZ9_35165 [Streptomyces sp. NPDC001691]|uniref:hypothetical protein n=1 Tax=Streptomyces sp. NPDC001691 TaxID=3364600 RepID=UPI0036788C22
MPIRPVRRSEPNQSAAEGNVALVETLRLAVPLHIAELRGHPTDVLIAIAGRSASVVGSKGDVLQFHSPKRGTAAEAFNALARGLAAAAIVTHGGVTFAGSHWCTVHACSGPDADHPQPDLTPS